MTEARPENPRVQGSAFASFTPADSPLIWEDYLEDPDLADLRTTDLVEGSDAPDFELPLLDLGANEPTFEGAFHLDDAVGRAYGGLPNRLVLVDGDRRVAYISGEGPMGFHPDELAAAIESLG